MMRRMIFILKLVLIKTTTLSTKLLMTRMSRSGLMSSTMRMMVSTTKSITTNQIQSTIQLSLIRPAKHSNQSTTSMRMISMTMMSMITMRMKRKVTIVIAMIAMTAMIVTIVTIVMMRKSIGEEVKKETTSVMTRSMMKSIESDLI